MTIPAIDQNPGEGGENERGDLSEESDDAEEEYGAGEPIYEPAGGDPRDPGTYERDRLAAGVATRALSAAFSEAVREDWAMRVSRLARAQ